MQTIRHSDDSDSLRFRTVQTLGLFADTFTYAKSSFVCDSGSEGVRPRPKDRGLFTRSLASRWLRFIGILLSSSYRLSKIRTSRTIGRFGHTDYSDDSDSLRFRTVQTLGLFADTFTYAKSSFVCDSGSEGVRPRPKDRGLFTRSLASRWLRFIGILLSSSYRLSKIRTSRTIGRFGHTDYSDDSD